MKVLLVDDEKPARERLRRLLDELPGYECCGEAGNGLEALDRVAAEAPDIVLMDIRMPGMDGLEAASHLATLPKPPALIFTTAYGEHALEAFDTHAVGYLLKPIPKDKLAAALNKARILNRAQLAGLGDGGGNRRGHICARLGGRLELIPLADILYFQADQKYVTVRHRRGEVIIEESLKALETEFADAFMRIHRNALIAKAHLAGLETTADGRLLARLRGAPEPLEVSRRHMAAVRAVVKQV